MEIRYFASEQEALREMTACLAARMEQGSGPFHLALSGAGTAQKMYRLWTAEYRSRLDWDRLRFYWVDERCVAPDDEESNFKHADRLLLRPLGIPGEHIFRIEGERPAGEEALRYSAAVSAAVPEAGGLPRMDAVILGIGEDGHTASIFPDQMQLLERPEPYVVGRHPVSGQERVSMSGRMILNAGLILVPVVGGGKEEILEKVAAQTLVENPVYPASRILKEAAGALVFTDVRRNA